MPAKTEKQRRFMGAVMGCKKGKKCSSKAKKAAKGMSEGQVKDFLHTESFNETIERIMGAIEDGQIKN